SGPVAPLPTDTVPTQALPAPRPLRRRAWVAAAAVSVVLALAAGVAIGRLRQPPPPPPPTPDAAPVEALFSLKAKARYLVGPVTHFATPGDNLQDQRRGLDFAIELGLLYLHQRRLKEADELFKQLDVPGQKVKPYRTLGQVGQALVLAFDDHPRKEEKEPAEAFEKRLREQIRKSNETFLRLQKELPEERMEKQPLGYRFLLGHVQLRQMIARALNHNYVNAR